MAKSGSFGKLQSSRIILFTFYKYNCNDIIFLPLLFLFNFFINDKLNVVV